MTYLEAKYLIQISARTSVVPRLAMAILCSHGSRTTIKVSVASEAWRGRSQVLGGRG